MIYLYSGTPGSGKSLHLANIIWQKLRSGRPVIANFPIQLDIVAESTKDYKKNWYKKHGFADNLITTTENNGFDRQRVRQIIREKFDI